MRLPIARFEFEISVGRSCGDMSASSLRLLQAALRAVTGRYSRVMTF